MTIPYIPGIGDTLGDTLPALGQSLSRIIKPNQDEEIALRKMLITNPESLDQYIKTEQENPGFAKAIGGKGFESFVRGRDTSEGFKRKVKKEELGLKADQAQIDQIEANTTNLKNTNEKYLRDKKIIQDIRDAGDHKTADTLEEKWALGTTRDEIFQTRAQNILLQARLDKRKEAEGITEPFNPARMTSSVKGKDGKVLPVYTPKELAAYMNEDTDFGAAHKMIFQEYMQDKRAREMERLRFGLLAAKDDKDKEKLVLSTHRLIQTARSDVQKRMASLVSTKTRRLSDAEIRSAIPLINAELERIRGLESTIGIDSGHQEAVFAKKGMFDFKDDKGLVVVGADNKPVTSYTGVRSEKEDIGNKPPASGGTSPDGGEILGKDSKIVDMLLSGEATEDDLNDPALKLSPIRKQAILKLYNQKRLRK